MPPLLLLGITVSGPDCKDKSGPVFLDLDFKDAANGLNEAFHREALQPQFYTKGCIICDDRGSFSCMSLHALTYARFVFVSRAAGCMSRCSNKVNHRVHVFYHFFVMAFLVVHSFGVAHVCRRFILTWHIFITIRSDLVPGSSQYTISR